MKHPWDRGPVEVDCFGGWSIELDPPEKNNTTCKHGLEECERCGTTDRRDARHTTVGGRGLVARLERGK